METLKPNILTKFILFLSSRNIVQSLDIPRNKFGVLWRILLLFPLFVFPLIHNHLLILVILIIFSLSWLFHLNFHSETSVIFRLI